MKKKLKKIIIFTIVLNLLALSSITNANSQNILNEANVQVNNEKGNEDNSKNKDVKEIDDLEEDNEDEKIILEIEEKISILREEGEVKEEDIKEINLLIEKLSDKDIREKYEKILSELEEELNKDNNETEEEKDKDNSTIVLESIEKIDTQEKLQEAINSDIEEIVISGEINITSPIEIDRSIKITGLDESASLISNLEKNHIINITKGITEFNSVIIDGNNKSALINSISEDNMIFNNCNIVNANSVLEGAVISTKGSIEFNNSIVKNNINPAKSGIKRPEGGIISSKNNKEIIIKDSNFENNTANYSYGMMFLVGNIEIENSKFINNYSSNYGGVLDLKGIGNISDSTFKDNKVNATGGDGGSIYVTGGELNILKSTFDGGEANMGGHINLGMNTDLKVNDSIFKNADIRERGSAILIHDNSTYEINDSRFIDNKMLLNNGGTFQAQNATGSINNCNFEKNKNAGNGTIVVNSGMTNVKQCNFIENYIYSHENNSYGNGAAITILGSYNDIADIDIDNCNFEKNYVKSSVANGGAIYLNYRVIANIKNSKFIENYTETTDQIYGKHNTNGGAISEYYTIGEVNLDNNIFNGNSSANGGAVYFTSENIKISNSKFSDNNSSENGGAVYLEGDSGLSINSSDINGNESINGGGIYTRGKLNINNVNIKNNKADYGGGIKVVYEDKDTVINNSKIENNFSNVIGAGIHINEIYEDYDFETEAWITENLYNTKMYESLNIDESVEFSNNKIKENRRFINGFSEDKYKGYEEDLTKNIKTISSSFNAYPYEMKYKKDFQQTPFNNIDINILDYEYFISHNNPEGMKGYYDVEVYKGNDQGKLKVKDNTILEGEKLTETEKQKIKATLKSYSLNRYNLLGEIVSNDEDNFNISKNDIDVNGIWDIEILESESLEEKVNIKFNANGGLVNNKEIDTIKIDKGSVVESQEATRDGYKFLGWFKDLDDILPFIFATEINEDLELFAKWEKIEVEKPEEPKEEPGGGGTKPSTPDVEDKEDKEKETIDDKVEKILEENKDSVVVGKIEERLNTTDHMRYLEGYPDGTIRPEGEITREEVSAVLFRLLDEDYREEIRCGGESCPLYDVNDGRWSKKHINTLINGEIVKGDENNKFNPERPITRAELITMINRLDDFDYKKEKDLEFSDIKGHWAEDAITSGIHKGWVIGFGDDKFRPDEDLTRAEFTVIMNRILNRVPNEESIPENVKEYKDLHVDDWYYYDFVEACNCHEYKENKDGTMDWKGIINSENEM